MSINLRDIIIVQSEVPRPSIVGLHVQVLLLGKLHLDGAGITENVAAMKAGSSFFRGFQVTILNQGMNHWASLEHDNLVNLTNTSANLLHGLHRQPVDGVQDGQKNNFIFRSGLLGVYFIYYTLYIIHCIDLYTLMIYLSFDLLSYPNIQ